MKDPQVTVNHNREQPPRRQERSQRAESRQPRSDAATDESADVDAYSSADYQPAEESLRQTEQKFRTIFDNTSDGIFLHDVENRNLVMCNKSCLQMLGYTEEEFLKLNVADLHPEADLPFIHAQIEEVLTGSKQVRNDVRFKRKNGSVFFADVSPDLVLLDGNQYVAVAMKDITERKRMEEELRQYTEHLEELVQERTSALRESETRYRGLYHTIADGVFVMEADGRIGDVNDSACAQLGYAREELIGMPVSAISAQPDFDLGKIFERLRTAGSFSCETAHRRKDGTVVSVELSVALVQYRGRPAVLGVARDINERKRAEEALRRSEARLNRSQEIAHLGSWELDLVRNELTWSDEVYRIVGLEPQEFGATYEAFLECVHPDDRQAVDDAYGDSVREGRDTYEIEHRIVRKDTGEVRIVHEKCEHFRDAAGRIVRSAGVVHDITESKLAEERLRAAALYPRQNPFPVLRVSRDGRLLYANASSACLLELWNCQPGQAVPDEIRRHVQRALDIGESVEIEATCRDVIYSFAVAPIVSEDYVNLYAHDVTERRLAEEALRESEGRHRRLIENLKGSHFVYVHDTAGVFQYLSESITDILGYAPDEFMTHYSTYMTDHPANQAVHRHTELSIQGIRQPPYEVNIRHKDGSIRWLEVQEVPVLDEQGKVIAVEGVAQDITERKHAEEALRESEERYRFLVESVNDWIWEVDQNGVYTYVSPQCREMLGYEPEEIVGKTPFDLMPPEEAGRLREIFVAVAGQAKPFRRLENVNRRSDGRLVVLETNGIPVLDAQGELTGYRGVDRDITERKWAEEALRESEERYRILLDRGFDGIFVHEGFQLVDLNDRFAEMTGYTRPELLGFSTIELFTPDSQERIRQYVRTEVGKYYELEFRHRDGHTVQVESFGAPCKFQGRDARIVALRDITERKRAAEALREKEYLLSESQRIGHIGTWSVDLIAHAATWTRETYRLFGVAPETFTPSAETLIGLLHPDDRDAMREWMRAALAGERPDALEFRVVLPDGSVRTLSGRGELICGDDNEPVRLVGTAQDVTEQKQAEAALRRLSRKNEEALRVARMGHWEFDFATEMFTFNDQYYTLHGTTALEAGGCRMTAEEFARRYVHPDDAHIVQESIHEAAVSEDPDFQFQTEARILRTDGEARWVTVWFRIEKDAQGKTSKLHGVNQDITERRGAEEALRRWNENLELQVAQRTEALTHMVARLQQLTWELSQAEDRERRRIADLLHDDVQQILAGARFHLNLLSTETRSAEESQEIIRLVRQMLKEAIEKARNLSHELSPALYQVDLGEILHWLGDHMRRKHGLTVHVTVQGQADSSSEPMKALVYKVAQELLFNVVKHAGVREATVRVRHMRRYICLSVTDRGRGFDPRELEKATGFGLLSIHERVHLLGGRMKVKSAPGMGSRFRIVVPDQGPRTVETKGGRAAEGM